MTVYKRLLNMMPVIGLHFSRPVVLFQSDDWGFVGIRDREGFDEVCALGLSLGTDPYDFYSLETAEDLHRLYDLLFRHHDSTGRSPCFVFNFILANVDFPRVVDSGFNRLDLLPLDHGLPGRWHRPGLLEGYREGVERGIVYPAFHGLTHFSQSIAKKILGMGDDGRGSLLRNLYRADIPLIYGLTPWIGFEYRASCSKRSASWLDLPTQGQLIEEGVKVFQRLFGRLPQSACAPGYRANDDTRKAWRQSGIKVGQNSPGLALAPYFDRQGLLHLYRNVSFEPAADPNGFDEQHAMRKAEEAAARGKPIIVSMHSFNFHSSLKNYRDLTLQRLDRFLTWLEERYDDLLYMHDGDIWDLAQNEGSNWNRKKPKIKMSKRLQASPWLRYRLIKPGSQVLHRA